ncbi:thiol-disulfide oxidoreductase DCC family protein [Ornithinibacillus halotolerans]|uniref:Thiol-disulfide oxidoreductase n=1 Tax=Ornithinibacillus halotolerans TaxID=1274357 RepID=A0A916S1A0_9BACI|nr:thiol-disulfide oxidoreductase DCC family protein [Ornithinibacillus halotolerans]GGA77512.1 hypothetical protein GCM10008025_21370 [Ornithinibacillus halotolerans]
MERIILFDGECNLCNNTVQFVIKRDPKGIFKFTALQSRVGEGLLKEKKIPNDWDSFILIEGEKVYTKSTAALKVCRNLSGFIKLLYVFIIIPSQLRNPIYNFIARNRYKWFGKRDSCMIPTPELKERFLD